MPNIVAVHEILNLTNTDVTFVGTGSNKGLVVITASTQDGDRVFTDVTLNGVSADAVYDNGNADGGMSHSGGVAYFTGSKIPAAATTWTVSTLFSTAISNKAGLIIELDDCNQTTLGSVPTFEKFTGVADGTPLTTTLTGQAGKFAISYIGSSDSVDATPDLHQFGGNLTAVGTNSVSRNSTSVAYDASVATSSEDYVWTMHHNSALDTADTVVVANFVINAPDAGPTGPLVKPSGITGLKGTHPLNSNILAFYELGQTDKELVSDTAITSTAVNVNDADVGEAKTFDADGLLSNTLDVSDPYTILVIANMTGSHTEGGNSTVTFADHPEANGSKTSLIYTGFNGGVMRSEYRGFYGATREVLGAPYADAAALNQGQAIAATFSPTEDMRIYENGSLSNAVYSANPSSSFDVPKTLSFMSIIGSTGSANVAAIVVFDKVLSPTELADVTSDPWNLIASPATTEPVFTGAPASTNATAIGHDIIATSDSVGTMYVVQMVNGATPPSSADVKAGVVSGEILDSGSVATAIGVQASVTLNGGVSGTDYDYYVVAEGTILQSAPVLVEALTTGTATILIGSTNPATPIAKSSFVINVTNASPANKTLTINGHTLVPDSQTATTITVNSFPYPWELDVTNSDVGFYKDYDLVVTDVDDGNATATQSIQVAPVATDDYHVISWTPPNTDSIYNDDGGVVSGDEHWGRQLDGDTGITVSVDGVVSNVEEGDRYGYRIWQDSSSEWSNEAIETFSILGGAATISSVESSEAGLNEVIMGEALTVYVDDSAGITLVFINGIQCTAPAIIDPTTLGVAVPVGLNTLIGTTVEVEVFNGELSAPHNATLAVASTWGVTAGAGVINVGDQYLGTNYAGTAPVNGDQFIAELLSTSENIAVTIAATGEVTLATVPTATQTFSYYVIKGSDGTVGPTDTYEFTVAGSVPSVSGEQTPTITEGSTAVGTYNFTDGPITNAYLTGADLGLLGITNAGVLTLDAPADYATKNSYSVNIVATNANGDSTPYPVTVLIIEDAPEVITDNAVQPNGTASIIFLTDSCQAVDAADLSAYFDLKVDGVSITIASALLFAPTLIGITWDAPPTAYSTSTVTLSYTHGANGIVTLAGSTPMASFTDIVLGNGSLEIDPDAPTNPVQGFPKFVEGMYKSIKAGASIDHVEMGSAITSRLPLVAWGMTNLIIEFDDGFVVEEGTILEFLVSFEAAIVAGKTLGVTDVIYDQCVATLPNMSATNWDIKYL